MMDVDVTGRPIELPAVDLERLFRPKLVAVVGASDRPGSQNRGVWKRLLEWGVLVGADVVPVNPTKQSIDGRRCVASIADVDGEVDVAVLLVGDVTTALQEAIDKNARFAVAFASGFAEAGADGRAAQQRLGELVARSELRLLGPNTNLNLFESFREDIDGAKIALITQSGHQGRPISRARSSASDSTTGLRRATRSISSSPTSSAGSPSSPTPASSPPTSRGSRTAGRSSSRPTMPCAPVCRSSA